MPAPPLASLLEDPVLQAVAETAAPLPTHLVGGRLRDHRLGIESHDVDVVVAGTDARSGLAVAEALSERLPARLVLLGGHDFAAYRLVRRDLTLDVWDRAGASLEADLARRDLTVNAVALTLTGEARGEVVDPHGGLGDLDRRLLRAVTPASFSGDPLRVLRLPRFLVQLPGFRAHPSTLELAHRAAPDLAAVAAERVREELDRIFAHDERGAGLATLAALDLYPGLFVGRPGEPGTAGDAVAEIAALPGAMARLAELAPGLGLDFDPPTARLASALHHLRGVSPLQALTRLREAGYVTRRVAERARPLLDWPRPPASEVESRHFLHHQGELWPTATALLGARADAAPGGDAPAWEATARRLVHLVEREGDAILDPPRLLGGAEVQELLGLRPGPEVGRALAKLRAAQIEGRVRTREAAEELLRRTG